MGLHGLSKKLGKVENLLGVDLNGDGKIGDKPGQPANNAAAPGGYPGAAGGQGGYQQPPQQGHPGAPQGAYPGANAGAPHGGGYPGAAPQGGAFPGAPNQGGYPGQAGMPGVPPQGGGYPGGMPGVPPQGGGYPGLTPQGGAFPGAPPQGGGYPGQGGAPGYPPVGAGAPFGAPGAGGYPGQPDGDKGMGKVAAGAVGAGALAYGVHHHHQGQQQQQQQEQNNHHAAAAAGAGLAAGGLAYGMHQHNQGQQQQNNHHAAGGLAFFNHANNHEQRNYVLIVDRSGSMGGRRWKEAQEAVQTLAPFICKFDHDGICLYLFETNFKKFNNIKTPDQVARIFSEHRPSGGTYLHKVLDAAFDDHFREFQRSRRGTTILVVTDGAPSVASAVETSIRNATHKMSSDPELSISFIQIGDDNGATRFLKGLDDSLRGAKFDIVDTMKDEHATSMSFAQLINLSIHD